MTRAGATSAFNVRPASDPRSRWPFIAPGVELFHSGVFRQGETDPETGESLEFRCSPEDVKTMVRNFRNFSRGDRPVLDHGITVGHEDNESELFTDDSVPQYGQILRTWHEWRPVNGQRKLFLMGDIGLGHEAAEHLKRGRLRRISAEIKETPPDGCDGDGYTLVRAALLGFAPAGVKRLKNVTMPRPNPAFSDRHKPHRYVRRFGDRIVMFSDLRKFTMNDEMNTGTDTMDQDGDMGSDMGGQMSRDLCIKWLTDNGYDPESLKVDDNMSDENLNDLVQVLQRVVGGSDQTDGNEDFADFSDPMMDEDPNLIGDPDDPGNDPSQFSSCGKKRTFSAGDVYRLKQDVVRLTNALQQQNAVLKTMQRNGQTLSRQQQRDQIHQFCDQMVREGRMSRAAAEQPSKDNRAGGEDFARLTRAMGDTRTHTFSANGRKIKKTTLQVEMDAIRARKPRTFSEILPAKSAGGSQLSPFGTAYKKRVEQQMANAKR